MLVEDVFFTVMQFLWILMLLHETDVLLRGSGGRRGTQPA
jgi:hypothetical protein